MEACYDNDVVIYDRRATVHVRAAQRTGRSHREICRLGRNGGAVEGQDGEGKSERNTGGGTGGDMRPDPGAGGDKPPHAAG